MSIFTAQHLTLNDIDAFIFDFDGVLTNNIVHLDQEGREWVSCSRADGLAFDMLRKIQKPAYILSTEKNPVVSARAKKLRVPVIQGVDDKISVIQELAQNEKYLLERVFYVGNDVNDYRAMERCGYTACPLDSHPMIKKIATFNLESKGGEGVVREILEDVLSINFIEVLY